MPFTRLVLIVVGVLALDLEARAGGVDEQHVDFQVEEVPNAPEHVTLNLVVRFEQVIHRPVELLHLHVLQARNEGALRDPAFGRELATGIERALRDQREQQPLDRHPETTTRERLRQGALDAEPLPHGVKHEGATIRLGAEELEGSLQASALTSRAVRRREGGRLGVGAEGVARIVTPRTPHAAKACRPPHPEQTEVGSVGRGMRRVATLQPLAPPLLP